MKKVASQNFLLLLFLFLIVAVPISWITINKPTRQESLVEARFLSTFHAPNLQTIKTGVKRILQFQPREAMALILGQYLDHSYQKKFEAASSDQFPLRFLLIQFARALDRNMIELAYSPLPDPAIPAAMDSVIYVTRDKSRLIAGPAGFNNTIKNSIDHRIMNLKSIINENPDKTFYFFYHETLPSSKYHPLNQFFINSDRGQAFEYFTENKPKNLTLGSLQFSNLNELMDDYFKTDHHWNMHGISSAYNEIYAMLSQNNPEISPALDLKNLYTIPDIEFSGSYARETMYPIPGEKFEIAKLNLPPYKILSNGELFNDRSGYIQSNYSKEKFTNYYGIFFGEIADSTEYIYENDSDRNLLLIGSSYSRPLIPLLAYHYKHTYYVDLRYLNDFSFSEFIASRLVDDVLIVADNVVLYRDDWMINP
jgi:hypothetical protein